MKKLKLVTRIIIAVCALLMIVSNYVSVWQIQLEAPQYPEGMKMEIWSHKIAGDIDKINNLNHYIGMSQIKEENFPEFKVMPYMIWGFVLLGLITAIAGRRILLWVLTFVLVGSGIWGVYDFWHWEYEYGHNLNPHAAIKLPGMSYQPPLIGWKQLLNFLAGSFPDLGGWLIIGPAAIVILLLIFETFRKQ